MSIYIQFLLKTSSIIFEIMNKTHESKTKKGTYPINHLGHNHYYDLVLLMFCNTLSYFPNKHCPYLTNPTESCCCSSICPPEVSAVLQAGSQPGPVGESAVASQGRAGSHERGVCVRDSSETMDLMACCVGVRLALVKIWQTNG